MKKKIIAFLLVICLMLFAGACADKQDNSVPNGPDNTVTTPGGDEIQDPGKDPGGDTEKDPGKDPGDDENDPGKDPGGDDENDPGKDPGGDDENDPPADTEYTGEKEIYPADNGTVLLGLKMNGNSVRGITVNGTDATATPQVDEESVSVDLTDALGYGANKVLVTDSADKTFAFIVYSGVAKEDIAYFDFDINTYSNTNSTAVPSTIEQNGIDGASLHLTKNSGDGNLFGFFPDGENGFAEFAFKANTEYKLSFDYKVLSGTSENWWCPIRFGNNGDVIYIYDDYKWGNPAVNLLYTQTTLQENADGSYRATAVFKTTADCTALDVPSWGGAVNILLDNVCLEVLNPALKRIACVGDSITEAADTDFSYPEQLQTVLGYDEYFVFNFGKSAANVLEEGIYPYRTWAEWQYNYLKTWNPDVIVMMLGTNDGRYGSGIETYKDRAFIDAYMSLVEEFRDMCDEFYINTSPYAFDNAYGIKAADVNERIVNIQGWLAYENDIPLIDVHAAVKACDRASYFPDYIHGNDAGYGVIAQTVAAGLRGELPTTKYHLAYAMQICSDTTSNAYTEANQVYNKQNATKQEINQAVDALKSLMEVPDVVQTTVLRNSVWTGESSHAIVLPVKVKGESITALTLNGNALTATDYTVESTGIAIASAVTDALQKGAYVAEVTLAETGKVSFIAYVGYAEGQALLIDGVVNTYVNTDSNLWEGKVGTEFDGACIHLHQERLGTTIGIDADASFGFIRFEFKATKTYTISFDYIAGESNNGASYFAITGYDGSACDWDLDTNTATGNNGITASVTDKGDYYHFEMTFTVPDVASLIQVQLPGWFSATDLYMDNLFICENAVENAI